MRKSRQFWRRWATDGRCRAAVIVTTCGIGFFGLWSAADEYIGLRAESARLAQAEREAHQEAARADELTETAEQVTRRLDDLRSRSLSAAGADEIRLELVDLIRTAGCQFRQIDSGDVQTREWRRGDHPLERESARRGQPSAYELYQQQISFSAVGSISNIYELLSRIHAAQWMIHTTRLSLDPQNESDQVLLNMTIQLFGIGERQQEAAYEELDDLESDRYAEDPAHV